MKVEVNLQTQTMIVLENNNLIRKYKISSGKKGYETSKGFFTLGLRAKNYVSKKYKAKMPYAQFFNPKIGEAFHQTFEKIDGKPRSHGCIRMSGEDAKDFWNLTENEKNVKVHVY